MGVERSVTRWYVQRQCIIDEIKTLTLAVSSTAENDHADTKGQEDVDVQLQLTRTQEKLRSLGPCPKAMMG